jgi:CBS domain-containing protein/Zn-dependent protease
MGVELRLHTFFLLLIIFCMLINSKAGSGAGFGLWLAITAAVVVREMARILVVAWLGLKLRAVLVLPIGAFYAYADPESQEKATHGSAQYLLALAGPVANLMTAGAVTAVLLGASGNFSLLSQPWISSSYLLRSIVWLQAGMGLLHLLPAYPLDAGRIVRSRFVSTHDTSSSSRAASGLGQLLSIALMTTGGILQNPWLFIAGCFVFIGGQIEDQGVFFQSVVDTVQMREVMLTDFSTLSPSDTLAGALERCVHSLQEDFPVVRGPQLVGIVSRQRIVEALRTDGNGYVQSVMSRAFQVARPEDTLGAIIRRISAGRGLSLIPVAESGRVVGIVSVQNLMSSMSLLSEQRRMERQEGGR